MSTTEATTGPCTSTECRFMFDSGTMPIGFTTPVASDHKFDGPITGSTPTQGTGPDGNRYDPANGWYLYAEAHAVGDTFSLQYRASCNQPGECCAAGSFSGIGKRHRSRYLNTAHHCFSS